MNPETRPICSETYYPMWSSRGIRGVKCERPAKWAVVQTNGDRWLFCGVHVRRYRNDTVVPA